MSAERTWIARGGAGADTVVAATARGPLRLETLLRQAAVIAPLLPEPTPGSEVAFAFGRDRAACAAALLATWARGHVAAVPEDETRGNVVGLLARGENAAFLHDTGVGRGIFVPELLARVGTDVPPAPAVIAGDGVRLAAFLRRGPGAPEVFRWSAGALLEELDRLAERMSLPPGALVAGTLSPTALPGLLGALLVPLRAGARFDGETPRGTEAGVARIAEGGVHALVVTPAHARELARQPAGALVPLRELFCADEPLDRRHRDLLVERHGLRVTPLDGLPLDEPASELHAALREELLARAEVRDVALARAPAEAGPGAGRVLVAAAAPDAPPALADELAGLLRRAAPDEACELRLLPALPRDANGRLSAERLYLASGLARDGRPPVRALEWTAAESEDGAHRFRTRIPERYLFFGGHFTTYPVLAGVVQVHELALPCIRRLRPGLGPVRRLSGIKFLARIGPGDELEVLVREGAAAGDFAFEILRDGTRCAVGRLELAPGGGGDAP